MEWSADLRDARERSKRTSFFRKVKLKSRYTAFFVTVSLRNQQAAPKARVFDVFTT
jgi:hypothetical protein